MKECSFKIESFERRKLKFVSGNLLNIVFNKSEEIKIPSILEKICVSQPYFAFKKIFRYENILITQVNPEQANNDEISTMSIGEAGRHLAILGTCVCALDQEEKYYYLVKDAKISLETTNLMQISKKKDLYLAMESKYIDKKFANAHGILFTSDGNIIYYLDTVYNKLKTTVFSKLLSKHYCEDFTSFSKNPYHQPIKITETREKGDFQISTTIPELSKEWCVGHFKGFPILPTAFVVYSILSYVGDFLTKKFDKKRYLIVEVNLFLFELLFLKTNKELNISFFNSGDDL